MHLLNSVSAEHLRRARQALIDHGEVSTQLLSDTVARSWQRCRHAGLEPMQQIGDGALASADHLRRAQHDQRELLAFARPVMNFIYDQIRGSRSLVALADQRGMLLHALIDDGFTNRAEQTALLPGALWAEAERGTNAIGTVLAEQSPVVIHGGEHFLEANGTLTCSAAPVLNSRGQAMGVLDISSDHQVRHPHTFALVRSAARMIEDRLFESEHGRHFQLQLHTDAEGLKQIGQALLAVEEDGRVLGANAVATEWLRLDPRRLGSVGVEELLGHKLGDLLQATLRRHDSTARITLSGTAGCMATYLRVVCPPSLTRIGARWTQAESRAHAASCEAEPITIEDTRLATSRHRAQRALSHGLALVLQGESGTGKEVFARELHAAGARAAQPFVAVNCAALPETLIEAELFGYAGGAFTGARREGAPGRIREADGGTLFLDEIGDMPLPMQARLLRVLQDRCVTPLGSGKSFQVDFLLVCATHRQLREEVRAGRFREDLYYRINGLAVTLPPLRERGDFTAVATRILRDIAPRRPLSLAPELAATLSSCAWPGNLRQLRNVLAAACAMSDDDDEVLSWQHLPDELLAELAASSKGSAPLEVPAADEGQASLRQVSARAIAQVLDDTRGNLSEAARRLGISRNTLYRHLRRRSDAA